VAIFHSYSYQEGVTERSGVLMERQRITSDQGFDILRRVSQHYRTWPGRHSRTARLVLASRTVAQGDIVVDVGHDHADPSRLGRHHVDRESVGDRGGIGSTEDKR
jgi:hypothetical protein